MLNASCNFIIRQIKQPFFSQSGLHSKSSKVDMVAQRDRSMSAGSLWTLRVAEFA